MEIKIWDANTGTQLANFADTHIVDAVAWNADSNHLASGNGDHIVHVWDVSTGQAVRILDTEGPIDDVIWMPNGNSLITLEENIIQIWDVQTGQATSTLNDIG